MSVANKELQERLQKIIDKLKEYPDEQRVITEIDDWNGNWVTVGFNSIRYGTMVCDDTLVISIQTI